MKRIHKYPLQIVDTQTITVQSGFEPLSVQYQDNELMLWALVEDLVAPIPLHASIRIIGTGHQIAYPEKLTFIGTALDPMNPLVWHVFHEVGA